MVVNARQKISFILVTLLFLSSALSLASAQDYGFAQTEDVEQMYGEGSRTQFRYYVEDAGDHWIVWVTNPETKHYWIYTFTPKGIYRMYSDLNFPINRPAKPSNDREFIRNVIVDGRHTNKLTEAHSFEELDPAFKPGNEGDLKRAGYIYMGTVTWEPPKEYPENRGTTGGLQPVGTQDTGSTGDFLTDSFSNLFGVFSGTGGEAGLVLYIVLCLMVLLVFTMLGIDNILFFILGIAGVTALFYVLGGGAFPVFIPIAIISLFIVISSLESRSGGGK